MSLPAQAPQDTGQDGAVPVVLPCPWTCLHPPVPAGPCPAPPVRWEQEAAQPPALPRVTATPCHGHPGGWLRPGQVVSGGAQLRASS